jgi:hypothetical protein
LTASSSPAASPSAPSAPPPPPMRTGGGGRPPPPPPPRAADIALPRLPLLEAIKNQPIDGEVDSHGVAAGRSQPNRSRHPAVPAAAHILPMHAPWEKERVKKERGRGEGDAPSHRASAPPPSTAHVAPTSPARPIARSWRSQREWGKKEREGAIRVFIKISHLFWPENNKIMLPVSYNQLHNFCIVHRPCHVFAMSPS